MDSTLLKGAARLAAYGRNELKRSGGPDVVALLFGEVNMTEHVGGATRAQQDRWTSDRCDSVKLPKSRLTRPGVGRRGKSRWNASTDRWYSVW